MKKIFLILFALFTLTTLEAAWSGDLVKSYFHNSELQRQWAFELLGKYPLKGDEKILDYGSGDGKISAELSRLVSSGSVTGVDLSEDMLHFARIKFPPFAYPNLKFVKIDPLFADFSKEEKFDRITSFCVFHLVKEPVTLLKNLKSHLKPEGMLLAVIPFDAPATLIQAAIDTYNKLGKENPWKNFHSKNPMRTLEGCRSFLQEAGFEILFLDEVYIDTPYFDKNELISWFVGTITANWNLPLEEAEVFFTELANRMIELDPDMIDAEGRILLKWPRLLVAARN